MGGKHSSNFKTEITPQKGKDLTKKNSVEYQKRDLKMQKPHHKKSNTVDKKDEYIRMIRQETINNQKQIEIMKKNKEDDKDQFPQVQIEYNVDQMTNASSSMAIQTPSSLKSKESGSKCERVESKSIGKLQKIKRSHKSLFENEDSNTTTKNTKCCKSCKVYLPKMCWRQTMKQQLSQCADFKELKWYKYVINELEKSQKSEVYEMQFLGQFLLVEQHRDQKQQQRQAGIPVRIHDYEAELSYQVKRTITTKINEEDEVGCKVLKLQSNFHQNVLLIKKQISNSKHPLNRLIRIFKNKFYNDNIALLQKFNFDDSQGNNSARSQGNNSARSNTSANNDSTSNRVTLKSIKLLNKQIHFFIDLLMKAIVNFYSIKVSPTDLKKDLLVNLVTNFVLSEELYFLVFNLYSIYHQRNLHKLTRIMQDPYVLEHQLSLQDLKVKPQFTFDQTFRSQYSQCSQTNSLNFGFSIIKKSEATYSESIENLCKIIQLESPMCKLEQIYNSCTQSIVNELQIFWDEYDIPKEKLFIDSDNLQGILIYMVSRLNYPQIWTEVNLIEEFIPEAVMLSNRAFYMILIKASCEYLINLKPQPKIAESPILMEVVENEIEFETLSNEEDEKEGRSMKYNLEEFRMNMRKRNVSLVVSKNPQHQLYYGQEADTFFFDENCILQDELFEKFKSNKDFFKMTMIETN